MVASGLGERILRGRPRFLAIFGSRVAEGLAGRPRFLGAVGGGGGRAGVGGGGAAEEVGAAGRAAGRTARNCWVNLTRLFAWLVAWVEGLAGAVAAAEAERVVLPNGAGGRVGAGSSSARFRFFSMAGATIGGGGGGGGGGDGGGEGVGSFFTTDIARVGRLAGGGEVAAAGSSTFRFRFFVGSSAALGSEVARVFSGPFGPTSSPNRFGGFRVRCPLPPSAGVSFVSMARLSVGRNAFVPSFVVVGLAAGLALGSRFLVTFGTV